MEVYIAATAVNELVELVYVVVLDGPEHRLVCYMFERSVID